jgi:hypothetical protein
MVWDDEEEDEDKEGGENENEKSEPSWRERMGRKGDKKKEVNKRKPDGQKSKSDPAEYSSTGTVGLEEENPEE